MDLILKTRAIHKLRPNTEWILDEHTGLSFLDSSIVPPTEEEIESTMQQIVIEDVETKANNEIRRATLLNKLGITEEEARLLLGGN